MRCIPDFNTLAGSRFARAAMRYVLRDAIDVT